MKSSILVTMLLVPLLILAACAGGEAEPTPTPTPTAETTVRAWLDAYAALDADRLVALHIPQQRQVQRPGYESWAADVQAALAQTGPDSARSRFFRALFAAPAPKDVELEVLSESDREIVIDARAGLGSGGSIPLRWKFRLSRSGDQWLIHGLSGFVPEGVLVWLEVVVSDDQGNSVPGAQVTVDVAGQPVTRLTDDSGLAIFPDIMSPVELDAITVVKEGFKRAGTESKFGLYSVELRPSGASFSMTLPTPKPTPAPGQHNYQHNGYHISGR